MKIILQNFRLFYGFTMERYEFKVKGPKEKCAKIFLSAEDVKTLRFKVSHFPHLDPISQPTWEGIELEICRHPE